MSIIYRHRRNDTNQIFYIGKGSDDKRRAFAKDGRSKYWYNIVKKAGYSVEIITEGLTESDAFELEIFLIVEYGRKDKRKGNLCNMTDGGEGACGCIPSNETLLKMSKAMVGKKHSEVAKLKMSEKVQERLKKIAEQNGWVSTDPNKKVCRKCNVEKLLNEFCKLKKSKDGFGYECKECRRKRQKDKGLTQEQKDKIKKKRENYTREYRDKLNKKARDNRKNLTRQDKLKLSAYQCKWYKSLTQEQKDKLNKQKRDRRKPLSEEQKEKLKKYRSEYYKANIEKIKKKSKKFFQDNKEAVKEWGKQYRKDNAEVIREKHHKYYVNNRTMLLVKSKQYYQDNKEANKQKPPAETRGNIKSKIPKNH